MEVKPSIERVDECLCQGDEDLGLNETFFCKYHQVRKTSHFHTLCKTKFNYREAWNNGRGPGHYFIKPDPNPSIRKARKKTFGPGSELSRLLGCGGCKFANTMDEWGSEKCTTEIDTLIGMLLKSRTKMSESAARKLIELSIKKSISNIA